MKKKLKKFFVVLLVLLLIGGAAAGGAYAYQSYQKENTQTQVFYVSNLSYGYSSDAMTSAGYVTNDYEQSVYLEDKSVVEVKVEEGTKVKIGDPLLVLDTTEEQLQIDMKNLELQKVENDIKIAEKDITELKKRIPGSSTTTNNQSQGNGTSGSGTNGTSGSGTNGTSGSGTSGTSGSGTNGSSGSGTNGTNGSGTSGTSGSGTNGSSGSGSSTKGSSLSSNSAKGISAISSTDDFHLANAKGASTTTTSAGSSVIIMEVEQRDGDAYNYIDKNAEPYEGKGTPEKPYRFLCTQECYVLGSYLNQLVKNEQVAAFEIWSGNSVDEGTLLSCWTVNGTERSTVAEDSKWKVATQQQITTEVAAEDEDDDSDTDDDDDSDNSGSSGSSGAGSSQDDNDDDGKTVDELKKDLAEKESDLKELQIDKKSAELELEKLQKAKDQATILATINGVVTTIGDLENPPTDGSAFMEISGAEGLYIKGAVSELLLDQIEVGQEISANSWSDGQTYPAKITEISEYPSDNSGGYYGEGNPNVSYYSFTAYMEESTGLSNGDYVDLSIMPVDSEESANSLYIEKAYVRTENGKSYVLKAGEDDRLVKQYVQTGKTIYGSAVEIKAGLKDDDRIAFPYGKTAKEGVKAVDSDEN